MATIFLTDRRAKVTYTRVVDNKIIVFGVIFSFAVGFYFGSVSEFETEQAIEMAPKVAALAKSFKQIDRKEMSAWESIEDPERKQARALSILGKATKATLETFNLGVKNAEWARLWGEVSKDSPVPVPTLAATPLADSSNFNEAVSVFEKIARTMKKSDFFNDDGTLKDATRFLAEANPVHKHSPVFDRLQGTSKGEILLNDTGDKTYYLSIRSDFVFDGKEFKGTGGVELSDEKRGVFSTSTSENAGSYFYVHPEDDQGMVVMTGKSSFVYLTLNRVRGTFSGSYFERDLRTKTYRLKGRIPRLARTAY